jgi:elongation factor 1-alpha
MTEGKQHVSIVICGHVDAGKSTTTGRLIFELGGIPEREMQKLRDEADRLGKGSFAFAFYMDRQKEERERGVTISCTTKEFFTDSKHYTVIDAPGHRNFIKNMITGASQADVALLMIPADGNFTTAIAKGNAKTGEVQGQTRQHALLINLLGVKQIIVGVNKMDSDIAGYKESRYNEIRDEMKSMLIKVGWPKAFIEGAVPFIPISGWIGDNLIKQSTNMAWWKGSDVALPDKSSIHVHTLLDALDKMVIIPERSKDAVMRTPISGIYKIKGIGDVLTGRVEQGTVKPGEEVIFLPTHTAANPCTGKVFTVEMHHKNVDAAFSGDNCGFNIKGLVKENMPRVGDIMILKKDETVGRAFSFTAQVRVLEHPGELKVGYCPIAFVRTGRSAVRMTAINWKIGKETGTAKIPNPVSLKSNEMAECVFEPQQPFVVDTFKNCEGLGRVAIMEGASVIMLGKVTAVDNKEKVEEKKAPKDPKAPKDAKAGGSAKPAGGQAKPAGAGAKKGGK